MNQSWSRKKQKVKRDKKEHLIKVWAAAHPAMFAYGATHFKEPTGATKWLIRLNKQEWATEGIVQVISLPKIN